MVGNFIDTLYVSLQEKKQLYRHCHVPETEQS